MEAQHHDNPVIAFFLSVGALLGVAGLTAQGLDMYLGIALKVVSMLSFIVAICYTLFKWRDTIKSKKNG